MCIHKTASPDISARARRDVSELLNIRGVPLYHATALSLSARDNRFNHDALNSIRTKLLRGIALEWVRVYDR